MIASYRSRPQPQMVAMYMRLSLEDGDVDTTVRNVGAAARERAAAKEKPTEYPAADSHNTDSGNIDSGNTDSGVQNPGSSDSGVPKLESDSIVNQRTLLYDFIEEHPDLKNYEVEEFVDDGFSGTNFNRPAFQRLLTAVKQKMVYAVIVKDFSRFGRDYIEVGDYIERFFPFMGVRFLSVADGYDSSMGKIDDDRQLEIAMKNIINTYYSRDLSIKIRSTFQNKFDNHEIFYTNVPFGFVKKDKTMVKEPGSAAIVERIFRLALKGRKPQAIAIELNDDNTPTPALYNYTHQIKGKAGVFKEVPYDNPFWTTEMVSTILTTPEYAGVYVGRKSRRAVVGSKKQICVPKEKRLWVSNHHESMASEDEYKKAQEVLSGVSPTKSEFKRYPLKGKVICGNCGHAMSYKERVNSPCYFVCGYRWKGIAEAKRDIGCTKEHFEEEALNDLVLRQLKAQFDLLRVMDCELSEKKQNDYQRMSDLGKEFETVQTEFKERQKRKVDLYEDYSEGRIGQEEFRERKAVITAEQDGIRSQMEELQKEYDKLKHGRKSYPEFRELMENVDVFKDEGRLTRSMAEVFLDKVVVHDKFEVEIVWNFADIIEEVRAEIEGVELRAAV